MGIRKISGGKARQVPTAAKASSHRHNDNGRSSRSGQFIITYCTCGHPVGRDFAPGKD
jgi:hypothetical protein